jgi:hypothetical protein
MIPMTRILDLRLAGLLGALLLSGCSALGTAHPFSKNSTMFCPGVEHSLSGLREPRMAFSSSRPVCAADRLKLALQLLSNPDSRADLARARSLIESVQNGTEVEHNPAMAGLASFIGRVLADRRRTDERIDKLVAQNREQQQRLDELNGKLQALASVERSMALKASKKKVLP